jgi:hypothetical protein
VLHDLSSRRRRTIPFDRIEDKAIARVFPTRDLRLAAFHGYGLKRAGVKRTQLIDALPPSYPQTAMWGQKVYEHPEEVDGIVWMSRQFDSQKALMLWGGRVADPDIVVVGGSLLLLTAGRGYEIASAAALNAGFAQISRR